MIVKALVCFLIIVAAFSNLLKAKEEDRAVSELLHSPRLWPRYYGTGAKLSGQHVAFQQIARSANASSRFARLAARRNRPTACLYGLIGLYYKDRERYQKHFPLPKWLLEIEVPCHFSYGPGFMKFEKAIELLEGGRLPFGFDRSIKPKRAAVR